MIGPEALGIIPPVVNGKNVEGGIEIFLSKAEGRTTKRVYPKIAMMRRAIWSNDIYRMVKKIRLGKRALFHINDKYCIKG
jgi:hypothetical protein